MEDLLERWEYIRRLAALILDESPTADVDLAEAAHNLAYAVRELDKRMTHR